ncbi:MAG: proton-conducting transporter membrane subunit [Halofilum sp. (in: g-proteobacteria)]|nr:proton-conducting transporter membrane subunit [Halofilum sp. (in: g-proteobacteria)]
MVSFPPGLLLLIAAAIVPFTTGRARAAVVVTAPVLTLLAVWTVPAGEGALLHYLGQPLDPVHPSAAGRLFATVFSLVALGGAVFALPVARTLEYVAAFVYAGAAIGVTFAGDWVSLFVCWELMAVASMAVVWAGGTERAWRASLRYIHIHILGGVVLMFGIAGWIAQTGSVAIGPIEPSSIAAWCMLAGILVNAGAPPLWPWIADAYPEASPSGTVFLSAYTTKTAVFVLLVAFPGVELLVWLGLAMIAYGALYALLADDMRRLLAHSIVGQVGFMLVCIGVGTPLALDAAAAHAVAHILYKALLLMAAGSVIYVTGRRLMSELGGLGRTMRLTAACAFVGGLAIAAAPLTAAFASKSLITAALAKAHAAPAWFGVMAGSALALVYVGLRFPWFTFCGRERGVHAEDPPAPMRGAMIAFAVLIVLLGLYPPGLYALLPHGSSYHPYTLDHVLAQVELLAFSALVFFALLPLLRPRPGRALDVDWLWRVPGGWLARHLTDALGTARARLERTGRRRLDRAIDGALPPPRPARHPGAHLARREHGVLGRRDARGLPAALLPLRPA